MHLCLLHTPVLPLIDASTSTYLGWTWTIDIGGEEHFDLRAQPESRQATDAAEPEK